METIRTIVENHNQFFGDSCVPTVVEVILILEDKVGHNYYDLQINSKGDSEGSYSDFDNEVLFGLKFKSEFGFERGSDFPIQLLFNRIDELLSFGRYVVISLEAVGGTHNYIIYFKNEKNDYTAISKHAGISIIDDVKVRVREMQGTEILTYEKA